mgnify:CR=1 FL=1
MPTSLGGLLPFGISLPPSLPLPSVYPSLPPSLRDFPRKKEPEPGYSWLFVVLSYSYMGRAHAGAVGRAHAGAVGRAHAGAVGAIAAPLRSKLLGYSPVQKVPHLLWRLTFPMRFRVRLRYEAGTLGE